MDPHEFIASSEVGTVIYGLSIEPETRIDFLVRESSKNINSIVDNQSARLETRAGLTVGGENNDILLSLLLFTLTPGGTIYETFWDYYYHASHGQENNIFCHMSDQKLLHFNLIGDSGEVEAFLQLPHHLQDFFLDAIQNAEAKRAWTRDEFNAAKMLFSKGTSKEEVWNSLAGSS
ncbi:MAG: hypothetical protein AAGA18_03590 [Verrucomicrobiota bacterium]